MGTTSSLDVIKGGNKSAAIAAAMATPDEAVVEESEAVEVDLTTISAKEIETLVSENKISTPDTWVKMTLAKKRQWLADKFGASEEKVEENLIKAFESKPEGTAVAKTKAVAKTASTALAEAPKEGEVLTGDYLADTVHVIESLKESDAKKTLIELREGADYASFKIGGILWMISKNEWFKPTYQKFKDFVEMEHGIHYRKAMYYIDIYRGLAESGVPWDMVKHLKWTKLKELASILTIENCAQWVEVAQKQTVLQLIETVKSAHSATLSLTTDAEPEKAKVVMTKTFKVHEDQKAVIESAIDKAKEIAKTAVDTVALEFICMDYLGSGSKQKAKAAPPAITKEAIAALGLEVALDLFANAFPDVNISVET